MKNKKYYLAPDKSSVVSLEIHENTRSTVIKLHYEGESYEGGKKIVIMDVSNINMAHFSNWKCVNEEELALMQDEVFLRFLQ